MLSVVAELVRARKQKVSLCYMNHDCEDIRASGVHGVQFPADRCQANQLVYGHGISPDFASYWHLPADRLRWITMVREPMAWVLSNYKQRVANNATGYAGITFDQCVLKGLCGFTYYNFLIGPVQDGATPFEELWMRYLDAENRLVMINERYQESTRRLARFLGATPKELSLMMEVQERDRLNVKPNHLYSVDLSEQSLSILEAKLNTDFKAYDMALEKFELGKAASSKSSTGLLDRARAGRGFCVEQLKGKPNMFRLSVYMD